MEITIRELRREDFVQVRVIDETIEQDYLGERWEQLSAKERERQLSAIQPPFDFYVTTKYSLVALADSQIVGFLFAFEIPPYVGSVFVQQVSVALEYQRQGIASALYKALIQKAKTSNVTEITANIFSTNTRSIDFHRKLGFTIEDRKKASLRIQPASLGQQPQRLRDPQS